METVKEPRSYEDMKSQLGMKPDAIPATPPPTPPEPAPEIVKPDEKPIETPADAGAPPADGEAPKETIFEINDFNKLFESEFTDLDSVKAALGSTKRVVELEAQIAELESLKEENLQLKSNLDLWNEYTEGDDYKVAMFKKQFPDKDAGVAYKLFSADLTKVGDREVIAQELLLDNPDLEGGLKGALELVDNKYGIEEGEELDSITKNKLKVDARSARANITSLKSQIKVPEKVDAKTLTTQQTELLNKKKEVLKQGWTGIAKEAVKTLPDIVLTEKDVDGKEVEVFRYSMVKDFPQETVNSLVDYMVNSGVDIDQKAAGAMIEVMQKDYLHKNIPNIIKAVREDVMAKAEEERLRKQHNPGGTRTDSPPSPPKTGDQDKLMADLNRGWQPTQLFKK